MPVPVPVAKGWGAMSYVGPLLVVTVLEMTSNFLAAGSENAIRPRQPCDAGIGDGRTLAGRPG
ncbi:hypothetical protein EAO77_34750 [Streptomyces sp. t39]|nr:hypothetical protein EAO77_34750 [Streptomyces sp. t39]